MVLYLGGQLREQFQVVGRGDGGGHPRLLKYGILFLKHTFFIAFLKERGCVNELCCQYVCKHVRHL